MNIEYLWEKYVPDFKNNRELPKKEQFTLDLIPLSSEEFQASQEATIEQLAAWAGEHCPFESEVLENDRVLWQTLRCVAEHSRNWRGLTVRGVAVEDVWGLYKLTLGDNMSTLNDINAKILALSLLSEDEEKNLKQLSDGSTSPAAASDAKETDS